MDPNQQQLDEELSACMDGELERSRRQFVIKRLTDDVDVAERWSRYHMVRAVMRKEPISLDDLSNRVSVALSRDAESVVGATHRQWLRPMAGGLIAASVAVVAVLGMSRNLMNDDLNGMSADGRGFVSQSTAMDRVFSQPATPVGLGGPTANPSGPNDQRLQRLMFQHQQATRQAGIGAYWPMNALPPVQSDSDDVTEETLRDSQPQP